MMADPYCIDLEQFSLERFRHIINDEKGYTRIMPTAKDIEYCFETAKYLPRAVEYL